MCNPILPKKWPQFAAAISCNQYFCITIKKYSYTFLFIDSLGEFLFGMIVVWIITAKPLVMNQVKTTDVLYMFHTLFLYYGAFIGTGVQVIPYKFGKSKTAMMIFASTSIIGWLIISISRNMFVYMTGLFFCGFSCGFSVFAPCYIAELAHVSLRGLLLTFFHLMLCFGMLVSFALSEFGNIYALSLPGLFFSIIWLVFIVFLPKSPVALLESRKVEKAKKSLVFFRRTHSDVEVEIVQMQNYIEVDSHMNLEQACDNSVNVKATLKLLLLHFEQQLPGISVTLFFTPNIVKQVNCDSKPETTQMILCTIQIFATILCAATVDRLGRKILYAISISIMIISLILLGTYFAIGDRNSVTPKYIIVLYLYVIGFSLGSGPLAWIMLGEVLPNKTKQFSAAVTSLIKWPIISLFSIFSSAFPIDLVNTLQIYFIFAAVHIVILLFIIFFLTESKGKTLLQIQEEIHR